MDQLSLFKEIKVIQEKENSRITLVESTIDQCCYIKKEYPLELEPLYCKLYSNPIKGISHIEYIGREKNHLIVIEEYIQSSTLEEYLEDHMIDELEAKQILLKLCSPLKQLHALGIVHRDIKTENIFYNGKDVVLFDLNIARIIDPSKTSDTTYLGSENYASPEQYGFSQSDQRSDIYSLGVLFFYLLTHHYPSEYQYHGRYEDLLKRMLSIDPNRRISSIEQVERILKRGYDLTIPGFRENNEVHKIIAMIGYSIIFVFAFYLFFHDSSLPRSIALLILWIIGPLWIISIVTNYMNIQKYCLFASSKNKSIQVIGKIITGSIGLYFVYFLCSWLANL